MTLYQFYMLSPKEKEVAAVNGEFLTDRREGSHTIALYAVGDFFVEIYYDNVQNAITMLAAFRTPERLNPYLDRIKLALP